ncbi:hypothetical protein EVA_10783 [gut metagenome]|uniref:Uncharacterized protein n=1 Tax=gut metagenome TaxID=749906 RepID=J9CLZ6_9ZZZZ
MQFIIRERQITERIDFGIDFVQKRTKMNPRRTALETILHIGLRKLMQHTLLHGELIEIGVQKGFNDQNSTFIFMS